MNHIEITKQKIALTKQIKEQEAFVNEVKSCRRNDETWFWYMGDNWSIYRLNKEIDYLEYLKHKRSKLNQTK